MACCKSIGVLLVLMLVWMVMGMATADLELTLQPGAPDIGRGEALELWQTIPDVDVAKPSVTLTPSEAYHWIAEPGQTLTLNLAVPAEAGCETALLTVWDWERHPVAQETFALPCAEAIEFNCMARGTWLLTLDLFAGGSAWPGWLGVSPGALPTRPCAGFGTRGLSSWASAPSPNAFTGPMISAMRCLRG